MPDEVILGNNAEENDGGEKKEATIVTEPVNETPEIEGVAEKKSEEEVADKDKDSLADESDGAPEKYEDFEVPEGFLFDEPILEKVTGIFKELNLTQEQAQKLISFETSRVEEQATMLQKSWEDTMETWKEQSSNDKEFGGTKLDASIITAKAGLKAFGSEEFANMLEATGVGNHPEMIRFLVSVGKAVEDDKILQGNSANASDQSQAKRLYPDMN